MSIRTTRAAWSRLALSAICAAAACLPGTIAHAEPAKGPLERLLTRETDSLCFRRDYDAAHLRRVPGQLTQSVVLSFKPDEILIMLRQQGGERYITASCEYRQGAGYDTSGNLMIKSFKGKAGYDCIVTVASASAEEGGYVLVDPAPDGSTLMLYAQSPITSRAGLTGKASAYNTKLGAQDRAFRLTRADRAACRALEAALKE
jgi:hypothetical protein